MTLLVDASVVIGHLRGDTACTALLRGQANAGADLAVSAVTWTEVLAGERLHAEAQAVALRLLESFATLPATPAVATTAGRLLRAWRGSHGLRLADAIVAATALDLDCPLVTLEQRHFACLPGLVAVVPSA